MVSLNNPKKGTRHCARTVPAYSAHTHKVPVRCTDRLLGTSEAPHSSRIQWGSTGPRDTPSWPHAYVQATHTHT